MEGLCEDYGVELTKPETVTTYLKARQALADKEGVANQNLLGTIEQHVDGYYTFLTEQTKRVEDMKRNFEKLNEYRHVIREAESVTKWK